MYSGLVDKGYEESMLIESKDKCGTEKSICYK